MMYDIILLLIDGSEGSDAAVTYAIDLARYDVTLYGLVVVDPSTYVDRIIMRTRGRSGLARLLLGSTTERVLRSVDVPIHRVPLRE